jgi:hypothetical protein
VAAHGQYRALPELLTQNVSDCDPPLRKTTYCANVHMSTGAFLYTSVIPDTNPCIFIISTDLRTYTNLPIHSIGLFGA